MSRKNRSQQKQWRIRRKRLRWQFCNHCYGSKEVRRFPFYSTIGTIVLAIFPWLELKKCPTCKGTGKIIQ